MVKILFIVFFSYICKKTNKHVFAEPLKKKIFMPWYFLLNIQLNVNLKRELLILYAFEENILVLLHFLCFLIYSQNLSPLGFEDLLFTV